MTVTELVHKLIALPESEHDREVVIFDGGSLDFLPVKGLHKLNDGRIEIEGGNG